ncbi:TIGR03826 family flagellar region protein [Paenibacillus xylaniclasticus]|uniref:TIGR03826 family flagellar region protein n=1 Tax=Paenibacillus xylaniclasticus TaxID=588083 RepID=UPI000FDB4434|nr:MULTISPECIES: TIGR03826 family flagellar region protein [Paenibacillus]
MNLDNCPRCGRLYLKNPQEICPVCIKETDHMYELCAQYLRENRGATIYEVSEATEVSIPQITKFIREGRISLMDAPNLGYPCETCGQMIREGNICDSCRTRLQKDISKLNLNQKPDHNVKRGTVVYQTPEEDRRD